MQRIILVFVLILFSRTSLLASSDSSRFAISFMPQYLFNNAVKVGFEVRLSKANWIGLSVEYYGGLFGNSQALGPKSYEGETLGYGYDSISGFGIAIEDKIFFYPENKYKGTYFKAALYIRNLTTYFVDYTYQPHINNGLKYYSLDQTNGQMNINQNGGFAGIGYAAKVFKVCRADFFVGLGVNNSQSSSNLPDYRIYERTFYDYQYSGTYPVFTFSFAYVF